MKNKDERLSRQPMTQSTRQIIILMVGIVLMFIVQEIVRPGSVTLSQTMNISRQASALGIVALGQALVILCGGIDLSVGSVVTITNVFAVSIMQGQNGNFLEAVAVCLLIGLAVGTINGIGVLYLGIAPFIMTLCSMSVMQGVYLVYTGGSPSGNVSPLLKQIGNGLIGGVVPYATVLWLLLALILWWTLRFTSFGRKVYAVGGNAAAAHLCGIKVRKIKFSTYIISSLLATVAGLMASGYIGTTSLTLGGDYINNSLAAVLIGGNAISGGKGGVWGGVLGAFFMMLLFALLTMFNIGQVGKLITQGVIIFGIVASQNLFNKGGARL